MSIGFIVILCIFIYLLIGVVVAGLINRCLPPDKSLHDEEAFIFAILWPIMGSLALFILFYDWISGK